MAYISNDEERQIDLEHFVMPERAIFSQMQDR